MVICHATGSSERPFELITINPEALDEHLSHGDMPGVTAPEECHAPEGVRGVTSEVPAAPVPLTASVPQPQLPSPSAPAPPAHATVGLLPTTGEPLVDLSLIALAVTGVLLLGLRLVLRGTRRV